MDAAIGAVSGGWNMSTAIRFGAWTSVVLIFVCLAGAQSYTVTDIGAGNALTVNDRGAAAGFFDLNGTVQHAFFWTSAKGIQDLGSLGGNSYAQAVNNFSQVAGWSITLTGPPHAFLWTSSGGMQDLGTLGRQRESRYGINDSGDVVGGSTLAGDTTGHAFLWTSAGGMQDIGSLGGGSEATAINNNGQVVGYSFLADNVTMHAFLWTQSGGMQDLGTLGGTNNLANGVNNLGAVAGDSNPSSNSNDIAFLWTQNHGMRALGTLVLDSFALGINGLGQVVGYTQGTNSRARVSLDAGSRNAEPDRSCFWLGGGERERHQQIRTNCRSGLPTQL